MTIARNFAFWALFAFLTAAVTVPGVAQSQTAPEESQIVFMMSGGDMPTAGAALHLAITAAKSGRDVNIVLLATAVDLGRKGANGPSFAPYTASGPQMLAQAMAAGAQVSVCQICLTNAGLDMTAMADGVEKINALQVMDMATAADAVLSFGGTSSSTGISMPMLLAPVDAPVPTSNGEDACDPATDIDACM